MAAAASILALLAASHSLASGFRVWKLVLLAVAILAGRAGLVANSFKQRLEFVDYR